MNGAEILQISEDMINPKRTKLGPQDFELKKVLGRGGYGKVFQVSLTATVFVYGLIRNNQATVNWLTYTLIPLLSTY